MTVAELIEKLSEFDPNIRVMICAISSDVNTTLEDVRLEGDKLCLYDY